MLRSYTFCICHRLLYKKLLISSLCCLTLSCNILSLSVCCMIVYEISGRYNFHNNILYLVSHRSHTIVTNVKSTVLFVSTYCSNRVYQTLKEYHYFTDMELYNHTKLCSVTSMKTVIVSFFSVLKPC